MIFNRRLANRAHQKVIYVETQAEKNDFVALVERHKVKRRGTRLTPDEILSIRKMLNEPDATAMCCEEPWFKPVILLYSRNIIVGDAFWRHELVHYQLRRYRRCKSPAAGGRLLLKFISMMSKENLEVFFRVTSRRYGEEYLILKYTHESILRFLEEMLVCSLADYNNESVMKRDIRNVNLEDHRKYLKQVEDFLGQGRLENLKIVRLQIRFWLFRKRVEYYDKDLADLINTAYRNPGARW